MTPSTTVRLYKTPFDVTNRFVIAVDSVSEALSIVNSYTYTEFTDCYWQRDDFAFRAPENIAVLRQYNYCVYINRSRDTRFAFIVDYEYVNDEMTLVHIVTDPWMTYAGRLTFNPSPMRRCHPKDNSYEECSLFTEPIEITKWQKEVDYHYDNSDPADNDVIVFSNLMLSRAAGMNVNGDDTPELPYAGATAYDTSMTKMRSSLDAFQSFISSGVKPGVGDAWTWVSGPTVYDVQTYLNTFNDYITKTVKERNSVCQIGNSGVAIPGCYILESSYIFTILSHLKALGRDSCILACYKIPLCVRGNQISGQNTYINTLLPFEDDLTFTMQRPVTNWRKVKIAPQLNKIYIICCGNVKELPYDLTIDRGDGNFILSFKVFGNPLPDGCLTVKCDSAGFGYEFEVNGGSWDTVNITGFNTDLGATNSLTRALMSMGLEASLTKTGRFANAVNSFGGGLISGALTGAVTGGTAGGLIGAGVGALGGIASGVNFLAGRGKENLNRFNQISDTMAQGSRNVEQSGSYSLGAPGSKTSTCLYLDSLVAFEHYFPSAEAANSINQVFSTYGYMQGGLVKDIVFKQLPKWHYYETVEASIEGADVPQDDLNTLINYFNRGIFVFTSKDTYKKFGDVMDNHY